jgi:hypothetical protein
VLCSEEVHAWKKKKKWYILYIGGGRLLTFVSGSGCGGRAVSETDWCFCFFLLFRRAFILYYPTVCENPCAHFGPAAEADLG